MIPLPDGARLVDLLAGEAEVGDGRSIVPVGNIAHPIPAGVLDLPPLLCRVVFVREPDLGAGLDCQSLALRDSALAGQPDVEGLLAAGGVSGGLLRARNPRKNTGTLDVNAALGLPRQELMAHHKNARLMANQMMVPDMPDVDVLEAPMGHRLRKLVSGDESGRWFPPEADGDFDVVSDREIDEWRAKLNARYGIGEGKLEAIEEPV